MSNNIVIDPLPPPAVKDAAVPSIAPVLSAIENKPLGRRIDQPTASKATIVAEFAVPAKESQVPPPQKTSYMLVLEVSSTAVASGMLTAAARAFKSSLDDLPGGGRTKIGVVTFDDSVHFWNLASTLSNPFRWVEYDLQQPLDAFPNDLLVDLQESRVLLDTLFDDIPEMFKDVSAVPQVVSQPCLDIALQVAFAELHEEGGKVIVVHTSKPQSSNVEELRPAHMCHTKIAAELRRQGICVDVYCFPPDDNHVNDLGDLVEHTAGSFSPYPSFDLNRDGHSFEERLKENLKKYPVRIDPTTDVENMALQFEANDPNFDRDDQPPSSVQDKVQPVSPVAPFRSRFEKLCAHDELERLRIRLDRLTTEQQKLVDDRQRLLSREHRVLSRLIEEFTERQNRQLQAGSQHETARSQHQPVLSNAAAGPLIASEESPTPLLLQDMDTPFGPARFFTTANDPNFDRDDQPPSSVQDKVQLVSPVAPFRSRFEQLSAYDELERLRIRLDRLTSEQQKLVDDRQRQLSQEQELSREHRLLSRQIMEFTERQNRQHQPALYNATASPLIASEESPTPPLPQDMGTGTPSNKLMPNAFCTTTVSLFHNPMLPRDLPSPDH